MKELKFLKYATIVFMLFLFFWVNFGGYILGTQGSSRDIKQEQKVEPSDYLKQEIQLKDAKIIGKFWNDKGHFIVVYNDTTKAPEIIEVNFAEWQYRRVGELY